MKNQTNLIALMLLLALALGCGMNKNTDSSRSTDFNPYKGKVEDLLPRELSTGDIKFKFVGTRDVGSSYSGAVEGKGFSYTQEAIGTSIQVDGSLVNYPSAAQADTAIADFAKKNEGSTLTKKGGGHRLVSSDGKSVAWTNGSLLCIVASQFPRPASNFEEAAPF